MCWRSCGWVGGWVVGCVGGWEWLWTGVWVCVCVGEWVGGRVGLWCGQLVGDGARHLVEDVKHLFPFKISYFAFLSLILGLLCRMFVCIALFTKPNSFFTIFGPSTCLLSPPLVAPLSQALLVLSLLLPPPLPPAYPALPPRNFLALLPIYAATPPAPPLNAVTPPPHAPFLLRASMCQ